MDLLSMLFSTFGAESSVNSLSKKTGKSGSQLTKLIAAAIPLLMKYLTKNASTDSGVASLAGALGQHTSKKSVASQIADADTTDGDKILKHILGGDMGSVLGSLSKETGMDEAEVEDALDSMTPALMSELSAATSQAKKQKADNGFDLGDLMGMFGGTSAGGAGDMLSQLLGGAKKSSGSAANGGDLLKSLMSFMG